MNNVSYGILICLLFTQQVCAQTELKTYPVGKDQHIVLGQPVGRHHRELFTATVPEPAKPQRVMSDVKTVSTSSMMARYLEVRAEGGLKMPTIEVQAEAELIQKYVKDEKTFAMTVSVEYEFPWEKCGGLKLSPAGEQLVADIKAGKDEVESLGTELVTAVKRSAGIQVVIVVTCTNTALAKRISSSVNIKYKGVAAKGKFIQDVIAEDKDCKVEAKAKQYGFKLEEATLADLEGVAISPDHDTFIELDKRIRLAAKNVDPATAPFTRYEVAPVTDVVKGVKVNTSIEANKRDLVVRRQVADTFRLVIYRLQLRLGRQTNLDDPLVKLCKELDAYIKRVDDELNMKIPDPLKVGDLPALRSEDIRPLLCRFKGWERGENFAGRTDNPETRNNFHSCAPLVEFPCLELVASVEITGFPEAPGGTRRIEQEELQKWSKVVDDFLNGKFGDGRYRRDDIHSRFQNRTWASASESDPARIATGRDDLIREQQKKFLEREGNRKYVLKVKDVFGSVHEYQLGNIKAGMPDRP